MKKILALLLALVMVFALASCNSTDPTKKQDETKATDAQPTDKATEGDEDPTDSPTLPDDDPTDSPTLPDDEPVDLGGYEFIMGDWWSAAEEEEEEPDTAWDSLQRDYHDALELSMNFTFKQIGLQNRGNYQDVLIDALINKDNICSAFQMKVEQFIPLASQGLLVDLSQYLDLDDPMWNDLISDYFTIDGKVYASRPDLDQPRLGVFFNKTLFEKAGIDPELPYDLQEAGEWDWAHFEELCQKLTKDTNNDGITDLFALNANDCDLMQFGVYSNGAVFVGKDENGVFYDGTTDPAFQEGLEWAVSLVNKGYIAEFGHGQAWDKAYTDFREGQCAMMISQTWIIEAYLGDMDNFGYVMIPQGTAANAHVCTNMYPTPIAIPATLPEEEIEKVAEVLQNWYGTLDKIEDAKIMGITFRDSYYSQFCDERSVDETVTRMITEDECALYDYRYMIPNYPYDKIVVPVANQSQTAAAAIEEQRPVAEAAIDVVNELMGN